MENKEMIKGIRRKLDMVDDKLIELLNDRMSLVDEISDLKKAENIPTKDEDRERAIIERIMKNTGDKYRGESITFINTLLGLSKFRQRKLIYDGQEDLLLPPPRKPKIKDIKVAYQGIPGAWSEEAAMDMFPAAHLENHRDFEDVFARVNEEGVDYGVVPIENSRTGAIGETYDLLRKYGCYITGQVKVYADHCLMGIKGAKITDIREVFSHPEGFNQCGRFLRNHSWDLRECRNTALAASLVAEKNEKRYGAIGSRRAAQLHGLELISQDITDDKNNNTRFIAIAKEPEYDEKSNTVSITFRTSHHSGALCQVLFYFMAAGLNLNRIESRPMMGKKYCFFVDIEGNINDENVQRGIRHAAASSDYMEILGCYHSNYA